MITLRIERNVGLLSRETEDDNIDGGAPNNSFTDGNFYNYFTVGYSTFNEISDIVLLLTVSPMT